jgi:hypothetical protein
MHDALTALRAAGLPIDQLSTAQRTVLSALTEQETTMLVSLQLRLQVAEGEVTAHELKML